MIKGIFLAIVLIASLQLGSGYILEFADPQKCVCQQLYEPVCDYDGNAFANECFFKCFQGQLVPKGIYIKMRPTEECNFNNQADNQYY